MLRLLPVNLLLLVSVATNPAFAAGEPAKDFINQLRAADYFDTALTYLDRIAEYPGVSEDFLGAIPLEKAQTYIELAISSRNSDKRNENFRLAEAEIMAFLKKEGHPRLSEARLKLGKLQLVRATQLMAGEPDDKNRSEAVKSYLAASKTFDAIVEDLRGKLKEMVGAQAPGAEAKTRRDRYRGEFLQAMNSAAESRRLAAGTYRDPLKDGKELLEQSLKSFKELSENYGRYAQGAIATLQRGQVEEQLGDKDKALDSYLRMLEQPDADALRDAKYQAVNGIIRLSLEKSPPNYQMGIDRGENIVEDVRPNERTAASVQDLRIALAKAYLLRSQDIEKVKKPVERKRAEAKARELLNTASRIPSPQSEKAIALLAELGIDREAPAEMPQAEQPESLSDAFESARELQAAMNQLESTIVALDKEDATADQKKQLEEITKQLVENRLLAIQYLQRGLSLVEVDSDLESVNQSRQYLAFLLLQSKLYRDATVVGLFLARNSPGSEAGLSGGLVALNALQLLVVEDSGNTAASGQLESLADFMLKFWPDNPKAALAQGVIIKIALKDGKWDEAEARIAAMPKGEERSSYRRLLGVLLWNEHIRARSAGDDVKAKEYLTKAGIQVEEGLAAIDGKLANIEAGKAALVLIKIHLRMKNIDAASKVMENKTYGPTAIIDRLGDAGQSFKSDTYSTELQVLVQKMASSPNDADALLKRAMSVMDKLRGSVGGLDAQKKLTQIYIRASREIRDSLEAATGPAKQALVSAFRVFLDRISKTTKDAATLQWVGQTLVNLAETSMQPGATKATGQAAELLKTAVGTFEQIKEGSSDVPLQVEFQLATAQRMLGNYSAAVKGYAAILSKKPTMLDAQVEAALAYEQWAQIVPDKYTVAAFQKALNGGKPDAKGKNLIWGWGKVSQLTSRDPKYEDMFFKARYHVALCRFRAGKKSKSNPLMEKAKSDITKVHALYPAMGGEAHYLKFNKLLKQIETDLGQPAKGLPKATEK
ncbi:hypothetical protein OAL18_00530 [bacterium]|nr:hypothetical protein [bacterium]